MSVRLVVLTAGRWRGQSILVKRFPVLIGQEPGCHLRLTAPLIGDRHCALWTQDGKIYVRDLTSASGTFLNGQKITEDTPISHSDCLRIGPVEFDVRIEGGVSIHESTPPPSGLASPGEEEDVASILLSIQDEPAPLSSTITIENKDVPEGSSADGLPSPDPTPEPGSEKVKPPAAPRPPADTPKAATNLLHKYLRRSPL